MFRPLDIAPFATSLALAVCLVAGCSDDAPLAGIGPKLDDLCTTQAVFLVGLPRRAQAEGLTEAEVQRLVRDQERDFVSDIGGLKAPGKQADARQRLVDLLEVVPNPGNSDITAFTSRVHALGDAYAALDAARCQAYGEAALASLGGASVKDAYAGLPLPGIEGLDPPTPTT